MDALGKGSPSLPLGLANATLDKPYDVYKPMLADGMPAHEVSAHLVAIGTLIVRFVFSKTLQLEEDWAPGGLAQ